MIVKNCRKTAWLVALSVVGVFSGLAANHVDAAPPNAYLDVNGTGTGSGVTAGGSYSWEDAIWSTDSTGATATTAFVDGNFPRFSAGTDAAALNFTVTANANHAFPGLLMQTNGGGTATINGTGILSISSGLQGFNVTNSTQTVLINSQLSGTGGLENEGSGSLDLYGNNNYSGGTTLGTSAGLNFNNNNSFGTAAITWGVATVVLADPDAPSALNIPNGMITRAASTAIITGPKQMTFSGPWTLAAAATSTVSVGNTPFPNAVVEILGALSGLNANLVKKGTGTLIVDSASNAYTGTTTATAGRLELGATNTIATTTGFIFSGGTLDPDGFNQAMTAAPLTLNTANSVIDYGAGAATVSFKNSSAATWTAFTLNLANWNPAIDVLNFGSQTGLTASQLAKIEFNGNAATLGLAGLDSSGNVVLTPEPATLGLLGLAALAFGRRRRGC